MHLTSVHTVKAFSWYGGRAFRSDFGGVVGDLVLLTGSFRGVRDTPIFTHNLRGIWLLLGHSRFTGLSQARFVTIGIFSYVGS